MKIYCCGCKDFVEAKYITGRQAYPHRPDLFDLGFWQCPDCENFVGTHKKTMQPLGVIATKELKKARMDLHALMDPLWKNGTIRRKKLYKAISAFIGKEYHTANTRSVEEINAVKQFLIKNMLNN